MDAFKHCAVVVHFLAGNRAEIGAVDGIPPLDPNNEGDAEYYQLRAELAVARRLADPSIQVFAMPDQC
jgi:hypothetical protein